MKIAIIGAGNVGGAIGTLTPLGKSLRPVLDALCAWGQKNMKSKTEA